MTSHGVDRSGAASGSGEAQAQIISDFLDADTLDEALAALGTDNEWLGALTATRSETGAVAVTLLDKFRERISALDFGLSTAGSAAANTTALQNAINAAEAGGKTLHIPAGLYALTNGSLTITNDSDGGIIIEGDGSGDYSLGGGTVLEFSAATGISLSIDGSSSPAYISLRNMRFKGNSTADNGIKFNRTSNWDLQNVVVTGYDKSSGSGANGVYLTHGGGGEFTGVGLFRDCKFLDCYRGVYADKVDINALVFDHTAFLSGVFGFVNGSTAIGVSMQNVVFKNGCLFEGNSDADVYSGGGAIGWVVADSYFEWSGNKSPIQIAGSVNSPISCAIKVEGNVFNGALADNTGLVHVTGDIDGFSFRANYAGGTMSAAKFGVYANGVTVSAYDIHAVGVPSAAVKPSLASLAGTTIPSTAGTHRDRGTISLTNSISGDVALNNTGNYFTGPTVAQGTSGTWLATGTVTVTDTGAAALINIKLWDGTTVIASAQTRIDGANQLKTVSLSGILAAPAGNIRIDVNDGTNVTGLIKANASGNSKDSTLTVVRIDG